MDSMNNKNLSDLASSLRKNMTRHKRHLWYDFLKDLPVMVIRYSNSDVDRDFPGVCGDILAHLQNC